MKHLAAQDSITQATSPTFSNLGEYFNIAYAHGYGGKTGYEAAKAMSVDLKKDSNVDVQLTPNEEDPGKARVQVVFADGGTMGSIWRLQR